VVELEALAEHYVRNGSTMNNHHARKHLLKLRNQIEQHNFIDHRTNEQARKLTVLIDHTLTQDPDNVVIDSNELLHSLKDSLLLFEVSHPTIAASINTIITTLTAIGA
jgi:hypothetical protein